MTRAGARGLSWVAIALAATLVAPPVAPIDASLHAPGEALASGLLVGCAGFFLLARRRLPAGCLTTVPRQRLIARGLVLTLKSAQEEAVWRGLVLGLSAGPVGRLAALALSTLLFAGAHVRRQGQAALAHLLTGSSFGLVYIATGRLCAAIAAHGTYNVLVGAAALAEEDMVVSDTGRATPVLVPSRPVSDRSGPRDGVAASRATAPVAELGGVVKSFGAVRALDGVDLVVRRGEIVALLGPNGAGKSTAVAIMLGLRRPDRGRALLFGRDPREPAARRSVGAVLQEIGFPSGLRVRETVELVQAHFPTAATTTDVLERLGLEGQGDRMAGGLSGGQRRRLAVALAVAGSPDALFLDEPTAGMDAGARRALLRDIACFAAAGGAVLLTTQQLAEAEEIASRVVLLSRGRIVLEGTVAEVRAHGGLTKVTLRAASIPPLPGITSIDSRGDRHVVFVEDGDAFVADLVRSGVRYRELEVAPVSLEDAFVTLTAEADG